MTTLALTRNPYIVTSSQVRAAAPAGVYLGGQAVTLLVAWFIAHAHHRSLYSSLAKWDGQWYLGIAAHGYRHSVAPGANSVAFFPAYPTLLRWLHGATGLGFEPLGIAVSIAAGVAAAYGLTRLVPDRRTGLVTVALFATAPMSIVLAMTYTEALFCALAVWALVALREQRWLTAAVLIVAAGLTRSTAFALYVALIVAVVLAARAGRGNWRAVAALVIAPLGLIGYLGWVSYITHTRDGWFTAERDGWGVHFDFGRSTYQWLSHGGSVFAVGTAIVLATAVLLLLQLYRSGRAVPAVYTTVVLVAAAGTGGVSDTVRQMIPAFPLLIPVAAWLARRRAWPLLAGVAIAGVAFSAYALFVYAEIRVCGNTLCGYAI